MEFCFCTECDNVFPAQDVLCHHIRATWGYSGGEPPEDLRMCPHCGSEDFEDLSSEVAQLITKQDDDITSLRGYLRSLRGAIYRGETAQQLFDLIDAALRRKKING